MRASINGGGFLRAQIQMGIKISSLSAKGINHPYELIYHRYHRLLITLKLLLFTQKVFFEILVPRNYPHCHLKKDISEPGTSLLRNAHVHSELTRLLYHRVCASVFYELFGIGKSVHIFNFRQKMNRKLRRNTFERGDELYLLVLVFVYFFKEHAFKFLDPWFKKQNFFNVEDEGLGKVGVMDTDRGFSEVYDVFRGEGGFSTFGGGADEVVEVS